MNCLRMALNDIRVVLKDRMILFWWLAMPMAFVFLFSFMFGDRTQDGTWLPVFVYDDHELATLFVDQLRKEQFWIDVKPLADAHWIDDWSRALVIPTDFSEQVLNGQRTDLTLTQGPGSPEKLLASQTLLVGTLIAFNSAIASVDLVERGWSPAIRQELLQALQRPEELTVHVREHFALRPPPSGMAHTLPAYLVMFTMMMTVMYGGTTLALERSERRLNRLAAAPVSVLEIFVGKMLGRMLQPILQGVVLLAAGVLIFRISLGDHPWVLVPVLLSFSFFCGAMGLLFGVLFRTEQQISGVGILVTMLLAALGGCWWPLEVVPSHFKTIAMATPTYWAVRAIQDVMAFGRSWLDVLPECAILIGFGAALTAIAIPLFRWDSA